MAATTEIADTLPNQALFRAHEVRDALGITHWQFKKLVKTKALRKRLLPGGKYAYYTRSNLVEVLTTMQRD